MIAMNFSPPPLAHDAATQLAQVYLAAAIDPAATRARLDELDAATKGLRDAIALNETTAAKAAEIVTAQEALNAREAAVLAREAAVANAQTAVDVAGSANVAREAALKDRDAELDKREADIAARAKALDDRLASYRQALA